MTISAGILPLFDGGKTLLLGKEYRRRYEEMLWSEFGGKQDPGETLAETACREFNEETAYVFRLEIDEVIEAEKNQMYIDYFEPDTNFFYRMYILFFLEKPEISEFEKNRLYQNFVEKIEWRYFNTQEILYKPGVKIYKTTRNCLELLKESDKLLNL